MADIVELMAFADQRIKNNDIEFRRESRCCPSVTEKPWHLKSPTGFFDMYDPQALSAALL